MFMSLQDSTAIPFERSARLRNCRQSEQPHAGAIAASFFSFAVAEPSELSSLESSPAGYLGCVAEVTDPPKAVESAVEISSKCSVLILLRSLYTRPNPAVWLTPTLPSPKESAKRGTLWLDAFQ